MALMNTSDSYGSVAKFFHWLIAILLVAMLIFGYFLDDFPKSMAPVVFNLHKLTGVTILALMVLRLLWALINVKPALPADLPTWQKFSSRMTHFTLYLFAILMPLSGWIGSVAAGKPPHLGDFRFELPMIPADKALVGAAFEMHGTFAIILIVLISLHVLGGLYHHFIRKDNVLMRMLPSCRRC